LGYLATCTVPGSNFTKKKKHQTYLACVCLGMGDHGCSGNLPPGFVFSPTDEELVLHFLHRKASLLPCNPDIIPDLGLYPHDPWQLEGNSLYLYIS